MLVATAALPTCLPAGCNDGVKAAILMAAGAATHTAVMVLACQTLVRDMTSLFCHNRSRIA